MVRILRPIAVARGHTDQVTRVSRQEADVAALLAAHFELMRASSPENSCHVMDGAALAAADAQLFGLRADGGLLGIAALAVIAPQHGELKSMHTRANARGKGAGRCFLRHVMGEARALGLTRISLETGTAPLFAAARLLYASEGFAACAPFGSYVSDPHSVFMTRAL